MKRNRIFLSIAAVIAASTGLIGCSMFHQKSDYYSTAAESRPLEVPPDLDSPATANELTVPPAPGPGASSAAAAATGAPAAAPAAPTPASHELRVADHAADTWTKIGPALEQAKIGKIDARDDSAHTYVFDFDAPVPKPEAERHWYTAVVNHLGFGEGDPVKARLFIQVLDDGSDSRVLVAGRPGDKAGTAASLRVMEVLHDKIPGATLTATNVPAAPASAAPAVAAAPPPAAYSAPPPAAAASAPPAAAVSSTPPPISGVSTGSTDLHVADSVPNTWTRVGLALERAQLGALSGRDENAHTYILDFSGTVETKSDGEHHWYTRVLHPFGGDTKKEQVTRKLTVRVAEDAGGARVSVEGDGTDKETADAARHVAQVLRERLT